MKVKMGNVTAQESVPELKEQLTSVYEAMQGSEASMDYSERHNINSAAVLTVIDDETAATTAEILAPRIEGKTVVEIGGVSAFCRCTWGSTRRGSTVSKPIQCGHGRLRCFFLNRSRGTSPSYLDLRTSF